MPDSKEFRAFAKTVKFECYDRDTQGNATYHAYAPRSADGLVHCVATIEKNSVWCGSNYAADSYTVEIYPLTDAEDDDGWERDFDVANVWGREPGSYDSGSHALGAAKRWIKETLFNARGDL